MINSATKIRHLGSPTLRFQRVSTRHHRTVRPELGQVRLSNGDPYSARSLKEYFHRVNATGDFIIGNIKHGPIKSIDPRFETLKNKILDTTAPQILANGAIVVGIKCVEKDAYSQTYLVFRTPLGEYPYAARRGAPLEKMFEDVQERLALLPHEGQTLIKGGMFAQNQNQTGKGWVQRMIKEGGFRGPYYMVGKALDGESLPEPLICRPEQRLPEGMAQNLFGELIRKA